MFPIIKQNSAYQGKALFFNGLSYKKGGDKMTLLKGLLGTVVVLVVLGAAVPVLWPLASNTTAIDAMTGTDAGTTTIQSFWPVVLLVVGIGLAVGLIVYGMRKFGLWGGKGF